MVATACALIAPAIALLASYPIARRNFRGRNIVTAVMLLPLVVPLLVLGIAMLILTQKGPVHIALGLWPTLLGHIVISVPYAVLLLVPRIAGIDRRLEEAAQDLGASGRADVPPRGAAADHAGPALGDPDPFVGLDRRGRDRELPDRQPRDVPDVPVPARCASSSSCRACCRRPP